jgi:hypothetical protein
MLKIHLQQMDIGVNRKGSNLKMYVDNSSDFLLSGNWWMVFGKSKAEIFNNKNDKLYQIRKRFKLLQWKLFYEILDKNNSLLIFEPLNKKHSIYQIKWQQDFIYFKIHKGRKKSIFKNNSQIASIDEPLISVADRDTIRIKADFNADLELIFLLVMCNSIDVGGDFELTFDFGNIGKMEEIDLNWRPK